MDQTSTTIERATATGRINWWLLLAGPLTAAGVTAAYHAGCLDPRLDTYVEVFAPYLVGVAVAIYWARAIFTRNPLHIWLTGVTASLLCREIHFDGMHEAIYVLTAINLVWLIAWRDLLAGPLRDKRHATWLIAALGAYVFSVIVSRRIFKHIIPGEPMFHGKLEECIETTAHLLLIVSAVVARWRARGTDSPA